MHTDSHHATFIQELTVPYRLTSSTQQASQSWLTTHAFSNVSQLFPFHTQVFRTRFKHKSFLFKVARPHYFAHTHLISLVHFACHRLWIYHASLKSFWRIFHIWLTPDLIISHNKLLFNSSSTLFSSLGSTNGHRNFSSVQAERWPISRKLLGLRHRLNWPALCEE